MKMTGIIFYRATDLMGTGKVPEDMLRYDTAFVHPGFPGVVAFPRFKTKNGTFGGRPTHARWESFCVKLVLMNPPPELPLVEAEWYTCRHPSPKIGYARGPVDYSRLEKITLKRYLEVKDPIDL